MSKTVYFYRLLGLNIPSGSETKSYVRVESATLNFSFYRDTLVKEYFGEKIDLQIKGMPFEIAVRKNTSEEVDMVYNKIVLSGYQSFKPPSTASWGQRVAFVIDPDGNLIEITADLHEKMSKN